jgi:sporulation protein YlmC with PRC-barrel domain
MRKALSAGLCLVLLGTLPAAAQVEVRVGKKDPSPTASKKTYRVSALLGSKVHTRGKEELGKVSDIVLDSHGQVEYLIVRYGDEFLPVPWAATSWGGANKDISVNVDVGRDKLKVLVFGKDRWPDFNSKNWLDLARSVWGERLLRRPLLRDRQERREERRERREEKDRR